MKTLPQTLRQTTNYNQFKTLIGNRGTNPLHLKRLKDSMLAKPLFTVITVNEKLEIIDGQHRFNVSKDLGLPINYVIMRGYGLKEVQVLNRNNVKWKPSDYVKGYCDLGYDAYKIYAEFAKKYKLGHQVTISVLRGQSSSDENSTHTFNNGLFKVDDVKRATDWAKKLVSLAPIREKYNITKRSFNYALIKCFKNPEFDWELFLHKLSMQGHLLELSYTTKQYLDRIEEIYNWNNRAPINLRISK